MDFDRLIWIVGGVVMVAIAATIVFWVFTLGPPEVVLEADSSGSQVEVAQGTEVVVKLEGNPTTGYSWEVADADESVLTQVGEVEHKPEAEIPGSPGISTIRFAAIGLGATTLELVYRRPFEEGVEPIERFTVDVNVN